MLKINKDILKKIYSPRLANSKKYDFGFVLVVGGSDYYTGSPYFAAMAAFRAGVDMVRVLAPKRAADIIAGYSPNISTASFFGRWFDDEDVSFVLCHEKSAMEVAGDKTAMVLGGGLGRSVETKQAVGGLLKQSTIKKVIDADGLHAIADNLGLIKNKNYILTPHSFEFEILTGKKITGLSLEGKASEVKKIASELGCIVALKGSPDIISNGKDTALNITGNPYMTVGGTGDTLAGIAGGFLAMDVEPFLAAQSACYINGAAGDLALKKFGLGMLATDLLDFIAEAIK